MDPVVVAPLAVPASPKPPPPLLTPIMSGALIGLGGGGDSIGVLKRRFTLPLAFCPPIAFSEYRKMLPDAAGYGFFEERMHTCALH